MLNEALGVLDTPAMLLRSALAGKMGASGRELTESRLGFDPGEIGGTAIEAVLDPLNLLGGLGIFKAAKLAQKAKAFKKADAAFKATTRVSKLAKPKGMKAAAGSMYKAKDLDLLTPDATGMFGIDPAHAAAMKKAKKVTFQYPSANIMAQPLAPSGMDVLPALLRPAATKFIPERIKKLLSMIPQTQAGNVAAGTLAGYNAMMAPLRLNTPAPTEAAFMDELEAIRAAGPYGG